MSAFENAKKFFDACETAQGWAGCKQYVADDATFGAQCEPIAEMTTIEEYAEWIGGFGTVTAPGQLQENVLQVGFLGGQVDHGQATARNRVQDLAQGPLAALVADQQAPRLDHLGMELGQSLGTASRSRSTTRVSSWSSRREISACLVS